MGTKHMMWVPLVISENTGVSLTDLCVSGDTVRRKTSAGPGDDIGKVAEGNQYTVLIMALRYSFRVSSEDIPAALSIARLGCWRGKGESDSP